MDRFPFSLSLYAIVSRECAEKYVDRALTSFSRLKPDEIVLCSAMGSETEKGLPELERVGKNFGAKVIVYENSRDLSDWKHLDSFCMARNKALEACTSEWCMWFDCDDILAEDGEKAIFKLGQKAKEKPDVECIFAGYSVPLAGLCPTRERITKNGKFFWMFAVHEQLKPIAKCGAKAIGTPSGVIIHSPSTFKKLSTDRNHRILNHELLATPMYLFYKAEEYNVSGDAVNAIKYANQAIAIPELDLLQRVQCHMILAKYYSDLNEKIDHYMKAYSMQPHRAEALYELGELFLSLNRSKDAYSIARSACAIPKPSATYWTTRDSVYDFFCIDLYERACRALGQLSELNLIEEKRKQTFGEKDITLCHATARPKKFSHIRKLWLSLAKYPQRIQHIAGVDSEEQDYLPYERVRANPSGCIGAWNECAKNAVGKYLVQMSDDFIPPLWWDEEIRKRLPDTEKPAVLAVSDGHRKDDLLCIAICTKKTLDYLGGHLFHPEYARCGGIFSDNEFTLRTKEIQVDARDLVFIHNNPMWTGAEGDDVFKKHNRQENYILGEQIFRARNP